MKTPRQTRTLTTLAAALPLCAALLAACESKAPPPAPAPFKPKVSAWAAPLTIGPISYFNTQCVTCHGQYGSQIADHNIAKSSPSNADYATMVEYMVTERAGSKLPAREMAAETAYCMSLAAVTEGVQSTGSPIFVCIKDPVITGGLEGEVTPGCTVTFVTAKGEVRIEAAVQGHNWSIPPQQVSNAKSAAGNDWVNATIEARNKAASGPAALQTLQLSSEAFKGPRLKEPTPPAPPPNQKP